MTKPGVVRRMLDWRWNLMERRRLMRESKAQAARFDRYYARNYATEQGQVETQVLFHVHQIEKGLTHRDFRAGFGQGALRGLATMMARLRAADADHAGNTVYRMGLSALHEYVARHRAIGADAVIETTKALFDAAIWEEALAFDQPLAGVIDITEAGTARACAITENPAIAELADAARSDNAESSGTAQAHGTARTPGDATFADVVRNRHAVREYADRPVTRAEIMDAIELAMRTPSVCNRQSARVRIVLNPSRIRTLLEAQGGYHGYATPPVLLLVSSDLRAFLNHTERNEPYVDGGLFAMSLLYALEYRGLAACPLNAMFDRAQDARVRELSGLPDHEVPVMVIAVGHFAASTRVCASVRFPAERIVTVVE